MFKKGSIVTVIFIVSTFVQLLSQIVITRIFGATLSLDTFLAAVTIPTIAVTVIYGTLNDIFLPHYAEMRVKQKDRADAIYSTYVFWLTLLSFLISVGFYLLSEPLAGLLYHARGQQFVHEVATQMSFMAFSLPFAILATIFGVYYYARKQFYRFPLAQMIGSIGNISFIVLLAPYIGVWAMVYAFVANITLQIIFVVPHIKKMDYAWPKKLPLLLLSWIPLVVGSFAIRSDALIIRSFGSSMPEGYLVYLNLISKIFALATGVMTIGIQTVLLPHLVEYISNKRIELATATVQKTKIIAIIVSCATTLFLFIAAPIAIQLFFIGGKFTKENADTAVALMPFFVLPAVGWGLVGVFSQPLLALNKQHEVGILNILALIAAWMSASVIAPLFGSIIAIEVGLTVLLGISILGSEFLWQLHRKSL